MKSLYSQNRTLSFSDCDHNNNIKLSAYLAWTAEIAGDHTEFRGIPRSALLEQGQVFLLSKTSVRFLKPVGYRQNCTLKTWEGKLKGVQFMRNYSLENEAGETLVESLSSWFLANPISRKIVRPSEYAYDILSRDEAVNVEIPRMKFNDFPKTAEHTVLLTELDSNQHMNNRFYGDMLVNYAPEAFFNKTIISADIAYVHEALLGEVINIHTQQLSEDTYAMYGELQNGRRCFDAQAQIQL